MTEKNEEKAVNPLVTLNAWLNETISELEGRGKKPTSLIEARTLLETLIETNNTRIAALKELRTFAKKKLRESEEKGKPSKNIAQLVELIQDVASVNHSTIAKLKSEVVTITDANDVFVEKAEKLEAALKSGPVLNRFTIQRPDADVLSEDHVGGIEELATVSDPEEVLTRIIPIVSADPKCVGYAVLFNYDVRHMFYFDRTLRELEITRGSALDVEDNPADGLLVYQVTLNLAVEVADKITQVFGSLTQIAGNGGEREYLNDGDSFGGAIAHGNATAPAIPGSPEGSSDDESDDDDDDGSNEGDRIVTLSNESQDSASDIEEDD